MGERLFEKIKVYVNCFLEIIFPKPEICSGCGRELKEFDIYRLCPSCLSKISAFNNNVNNLIINVDNQSIKLAYDKVIISCYYEGLAREMVHRLKYKDKREIAVTIAAIMADNIRKEKIPYDVIVPVPISKKKLKKRGYNHVHIISLELSEILNIPVINCIDRVKDTDPQVLFNAHDRWYNVKDCFKCNSNVNGKRILLVDDIITSGATAHFCSQEIKKAGAICVTVFSFAKSNLQ